MSPTVILRPYRSDDLGAVVQLFHDTVHQVNRRDYTQAQVDAWAPDEANLERWQRKLAVEQVVVAEQADAIVGFCSWDDTGYLDFLYVHHAHQRKGIASMLYAAAESALRANALPRVYAQASLTAEPFFIRQGFHLVRHQFVDVRGVSVPNRVMEKSLT